MRQALVFLFVLLFTCASAQAKEGAPFTLQQKELTTYFAGLGSTVGCPKLTHAVFTTINMGDLEYLPQKESRNSWSRVFAVTLQTLPDDESLAFSAVHGYNATFLERYARNGTIIDSQTFKAADGLPVTYIEYRVRSGVSIEHGIAVYGRHTKNLAAMTKLVLDHKSFDDQDRSTMKQLANTLAARK